MSSIPISPIEKYLDINDTAWSPFKVPSMQHQTGENNKPIVNSFIFGNSRQILQDKYDKEYTEVLKRNDVPCAPNLVCAHVNCNNTATKGGNNLQFCNVHAEKMMAIYAIYKAWAHYAEFLFYGVQEYSALYTCADATMIEAIIVSLRKEVYYRQVHGELLKNGSDEGHRNWVRKQESEIENCTLSLRANCVHVTKEQTIDELKAVLRNAKQTQIPQNKLIIVFSPTAAANRVSAAFYDIWREDENKYVTEQLTQLTELMKTPNVARDPELVTLITETIQTIIKNNMHIKLLPSEITSLMNDHSSDDDDFLAPHATNNANFVIHSINAGIMNSDNDAWNVPLIISNASESLYDNDQMSDDDD
jgi:hypothetical protein